MVRTLPISFVIPTMNRPDAFKRTIDGLMDKEYIPAQIIVVDQSLNDTEKDLNRSCLGFYNDRIETEYIFQEKPSLTKARNNGYKLCRHEIIVCSDDDVDVKEDTLKNLFNLMQNDNVAMVAGINENSGHSRTDLGYLFGTKSFRNRKIGHVTLSVLGRYPDDVRGEVETQWAMGYFFAIRKSLKDRWNLEWDERLTGYAYAEDLDFSYGYYKKAQTEKRRCIINEQVRVRHLVSNEYRVPTLKGTYMYVINREYISYKHKMGAASRVVSRWTNTGQFLLRCIKRERPMDMLRAQARCEKNRKLIKAGILRETFYE
ncbi:glycosyltransferase family 2 protein [Parasporobacterium paucivorans]|uniref:Glycosyl transferase family 2 n=1 Tax=Parasporobacterium paucivorans DSM 15970 TaxID=1122934 RepID=A0A1M6GUR9_9FIRM|nr:glycosyltransferase [Parasporobacterium paucivorans]SHJ13681.1 Glycosyl transferase family 2 [Parasporobacterium paucivorans DSM 15970]